MMDIRSQICVCVKHLDNLLKVMSLNQGESLFLIMFKIKIPKNISSNATTINKYQDKSDVVYLKPLYVTNFV